MRNLNFGNALNSRHLLRSLGSVLKVHFGKPKGQCHKGNSSYLEGDGERIGKPHFVHNQFSADAFSNYGTCR